MKLKHLSVTNFRNFSRLELDIPDSLILLVGENAVGKTSLLEAIAYLTTLSSQHTSSDSQLINFLIKDEEIGVARIIAEYTKDDSKHTLEVRIIRERNSNGNGRTRKEILLDGIKKRRVESIGQFNTVLFLPHHLRIIDGSPSHRRKYLDILISQSDKEYIRALSTYTQSLTQRNALLKQIALRRSDPKQLDYWDNLIASTGAILIHKRISMLQNLHTKSRPIHMDLTNGVEVISIHYKPAFEPLVSTNQAALPLNTETDRSSISVEEIKDGFASKLLDLRNEEIARGLTTIGPHRDDFRIYSNGIDLGEFGSRGQTRTTLLTLKLTELSVVEENTGTKPILLLDEVMAELDVQHRKDLLDKLVLGRQTFLTTTDLTLFPQNFVEQTSIWKIENGSIYKD